MRWTEGWQPAELHRQGRMRCSGAAGSRLVGLAMATDHVARRSPTLHHEWLAQIERLDLPAVDGHPGWVARWAFAEGFEHPAAVAGVVDALGLLASLGPLEVLIPPPGADPTIFAARSFAAGLAAMSAASDPVLERIRNMLAKAESTTFEAEATAFTAKAQELMTRHAIDAALLDAHAHTAGVRPVTMRVPIDAPYVDAKSLLLQTVAQHGRCRTVFHSNVSMSTLIGFSVDVAAVELLFTSLLVQAQTAMADAARRASAGSRTRSQAFRSSFLAAYTCRIGDRLREINAAVYAEVEAEQGDAFLPVLHSQAAAVDDAVAQRFPRLTSSSGRRSYDMAGWASGSAAAERANLAYGGLASR